MRKFLSALALFVLPALVLSLAPTMAATFPVPNKVRMLEGTYTGQWTLFGINENGDIIKNMAWTDVVEASGSQVEGKRAFVITTNVMTFEGGQIPPFKMDGKEGYALTKDGRLGDYFIEVAGRTHHMVRVGENVWSYTASAHANELSRLGFPMSATGQHVLVKVVTKEQGIETHRISRLTTVRWKTKAGKDHVMSFVSLKGHHVRQQ